MRLLALQTCQWLSLVTYSANMECGGFSMHGGGGKSNNGKSRRGRAGCYDDTQVYKSKNLHAERRRRQKLSDRLLTLRGLVPIVTNMNKANIIEDAITYIHELQSNVKSLGDQLMEMEAEAAAAAAGSSSDEGKAKSREIDVAKEMEQFQIKEDVQVNRVDGNRLLIKIILEKRRGGFTKLMEAITYGLGLELTDTSVTTSKGAIVVLSCVEGTYGEMRTVQQTKALLEEIVRCI